MTVSSEVVVAGGLVSGRQGAALGWRRGSTYSGVCVCVCVCLRRCRYWGSVLPDSSRATAQPRSRS